MVDKDWMDTNDHGYDHNDNFDKDEKRWNGTNLLLKQVNPNLQERDMLDAFLLEKAAAQKNNSMETKLDLYAQAIFIAIRQDPWPNELTQWLENGVYLAREILLKRAKQLKLDPESVDDDPQLAIVNIYGGESEIHRIYEVEAFRVAQVYFYYTFSMLEHITGERVNESIVLSFLLGVHAMQNGEFASCFTECLELVKHVSGVFLKIDAGWKSRQTDDIRQHLFCGLYIVNSSASKAAGELGRFSEALDWAIKAEPYVDSLYIAFPKSSYCIKRGELLIQLGRGEKALEWYKKAVDVPGLTEKQRYDAQRHLNYAVSRITGDQEKMFHTALVELIGEERVNEIKSIIDLTIAGKAEAAEMAKAFEILEESLSPHALEQFAQTTDLKELPKALEGLKFHYTVLFARASWEKNDISRVQRLIPKIEELAASDSSYQLEAASFLLRYRGYMGEKITWDILSPLVSRVLEHPPADTSHLFLDFMYFFSLMENEGLTEASTSISGLLELLIVEIEAQETPAAEVFDTAASMSTIDGFSAILVKLAQTDPGKEQYWLQQAARLKYLSGFRGQRLQKSTGLYRYRTALSKEGAGKVRDAAKYLTRRSLENQGKTDQEWKSKETELMVLLYSLYKNSRPPQSKEQELNEFTQNTVYPEIIYIEKANFLRVENNEAPVVSLEHAGSNWDVYEPDEKINRTDAIDFQGFIGQPFFLDLGLKAGLKLKRALYPMRYQPLIPCFYGLRSTGVYHKIPIDTLPMSIDEETGNVSGWVGECLVSVLLTGPNKDMSILEKRVDAKNIAVFSNSSFKGREELRELEGAKKEADAIEYLFRRYKDSSPRIFRERESNRENFLRISGESAPQVLHIATHGIVDESNPSGGYIVLSDKDEQGTTVLGAVGYHEIMLMDLGGCDLVILSACSTHQGDSILGEGIMGLAWAFKAAGAKAVIATRWPVDDNSAAEFWRQFYESLWWSYPIGKAFHDARMHIMKQETWNHPFYWGVYQLIV